MTEKIDQLCDELDKVAWLRSQRILERFAEVATSNVTDPGLLAVLEDVKKYWSDVRTRALFRPCLTSFCCEAVGGKPEMAETAGVIFTLAGSGFGIHDDILDKSSFKHLRMTILGVHGLEGALLVGDLLIVKAWTQFCKMLRNVEKPLDVADILEVYGDLSVEICEAEFMETKLRRKLDIDLDYYLGYLWKAMAETEACSRIGAMVGGGNAEKVEALAEFGRRLGFMSRLGDDIEDCLNLRGDLISRISFESIPLPLLYAAKFSEQIHNRLKLIVEGDPNTFDSKELLQICFETEAFGYVESIAKKNLRAAFSKLDFLPHSSAHDILGSMAKASYERVAKLNI